MLSRDVRVLVLHLCITCVQHPVSSQREAKTYACTQLSFICHMIYARFFNKLIIGVSIFKFWK